MTDPANKVVPARPAVPPEPEPYICPRCGAVSYNPHDKEQRYCGFCHRFEAP